MQKLKFLKPAIPLTVISVVIALLLAVINAVTADRIAANLLAEKEAALKSIFPTCASFESADPSLFGGSVSDAGKVIGENGRSVGYYADVSPVGFKGEISLIVGADYQGNIIGVSLLSASETPGVGTKATDKAYLSQFTGLSPERLDGIDTLSGATISSRAVKKGIKEGVDAILKISNGGKGGK